MGSSSLIGLAAAELTLGRSSSTFEFEFDAENVHHHHRKRWSTQQEEFELEPETEPEAEQDMNDRSGVQLLSYLKSLEEERRKIKAFKRELPLCMHLLTAAIKAAREELPKNNAVVDVGSGGGHLSADPPAAAQSSGGRCRAAVLEEFIPLRRRGSDGELARLNMDGDGAPTAGIIHDRWAAAACAVDALPGHETTSTTALSILTSEEDSNSKRREAKAEGLCTYDGGDNEEEEEEEEDEEEEQARAAGIMCNREATTTTKNLSSPPIFRPRASAFFPFPKKGAVVRMTETMMSHSPNGNVKELLQLQDFAGTMDNRGSPPSGEEGAARSYGVMMQKQQQQLNMNMDMNMNGGGGGEASSGEDLDPLAEFPCRRNMGGGSTWSTSPATPPHHHCSSRKQRRCWSSELHRKFVNALDQLGGAEVATPKLIREIMKVEGLTNDEVKSHLQKYRLHTRKPIAGGSPAAAADAAAMAQLSPQLLVLGGIWLPPTSLDTSDNRKLPGPREDPEAAVRSFGGGGGASVVWERGSCGEIMPMQWRTEFEANNNNNQNHQKIELNDWWKPSPSNPSSCSTWRRMGKEETSRTTSISKKTRREMMMMEGAEIGQRWWWPDAGTITTAE